MQIASNRHPTAAIHSAVFLHRSVMLVLPFNPLRPLNCASHAPEILFHYHGRPTVAG